MLEKLSILRQAWQQPDNKRAMGGIYALSGFDYQFAVFLLSVINRVYNAIKNNEQPPSRDSLCTEELSDITELTPDGLLYITQVKLRATKNFGKIFSEFWEIFELAKRVIPGDEDKLHFWLCTSAVSLSESDIRVKFRLWAKKEKKSEMTASGLEHRIYAKVVEHPEDQILHILVNQMRDDKPEKHHAEWKGRLLSSSHEGKVDEAVGRIREELIEIANRVNKPEVPIYVWQSTDRPPSDVVHGDVLTGSQPRVYQLRAGFFAPRPNVYTDLAESYSEWRQALLDNTDVSIRLPVFWIGGRSGTGKSIALLHLLANIHSQEIVRIFWLQQSIQYLPDAIRWAVSLRKQGYDTIIAADDPFAPATQQNSETWQRAFEELGSLRSQGDADSMPILLCCGPTEHGQNLRDAEPDNVDVTIKKLQPEDQADYEILRTWYKRRTGNEPPAVGDENVLLVQLFFEWKTKGSLPEFAKRFQDRINDADHSKELFERFSRVLAANRLYIGYPSEAFKDGLSLKQRETVDLLTEENHLADMKTGRKGYWLAHPHLSNAIYEAWYRADRPSTIREGHIEDIIYKYLQFEKDTKYRMAPLWAISRSLGDEGGGSSDFRSEEFEGAVTISGLSRILFKDGYRPRTKSQVETIDWLNDVLKMPDLYSKIRRDKGSEATSASIVSLKLIYDNSRSETDLKRLNRSLIEEFYPLVSPRRQEEESTVGRLEQRIVERLLPKVYRQRLESPDNPIHIFELPVWLQLRAAFPEIGLDPDPFDVALDRLQTENLAAKGFRLMCHKLLEHTKHMSRDQSSRLVDTLSNLITLTAQSWHQWPHVAADFYKRTGNNKIETILCEWLTKYSRTSVAQQTLMDLLQSDRKSAAIDEAASAILLQVSDDSAFWADVAKHVIKHKSSDMAFRSVAKWSAMHCKEFRVGYLLAEMIRGNFTDAVDWAIEWVQLWYKERSANWVLEALCERSVRDLRIRDLCISWLNLDHWEANPGYLAEKLIKAFPDDQDVKDNILRWLQRTSPNVSWLYVWHAAYVNAPRDDQLMRMGIAGLVKVQPRHELWCTTWQDLWEATNHNRKLVEIGWDWLNRLPMNMPKWLDVWYLLWQNSNRNDRLFESALRWMSMNLRSKSWGALWREFWTVKRGDTRLISLAHKWLSYNIWQWNVWFAIWQEIWQRNKEDEAAINLAYRWLSKAPSDLPSWLVVWEIIWRYHGADESLRDLGMDWLRSTEGGHGSWQRIWAYLWTDSKKDDNSGQRSSELKQMGYDWITSIPLSNGSWPKMWKDLWPLDKKNGELIRMGIEWVSNENNFNHGDWQHNWKELVNAHRDNASLLLLGEKCLRLTLPKDSRLVYNNYWVDIWMFLSKRSGITTPLLDLAKDWLWNTKLDSNKWANLWLKIREERADTRPLRQKVRTFIEKNMKTAEWFHLWFSLREKRENNKQIDELGLQWLNYMLQQRPGTQNWHQVWTILWETEVSKETLEALAIQWLRGVSSDDTTWHKIWGAVRDTKPASADIIKIGKELLENAKPHHQGWFDVWLPLFEQTKDNQELTQRALEWLENAVGKNSAWGDCWLTLYENYEDKNVLESYALTWLAHTAKQQNARSWAKIWRLLWDKDIARDRLSTCGIDWLKAAPRGSDDRLQVFDPLRQHGKVRNELNIPDTYL